MDEQTRPIRAGRFKNQLLSRDFLHSAEMQKAVADIACAKTFAREKKLAAWEWTALYIFILSAYRRPKDFLGGPHGENFHSGVRGTLACQDLRESLSPTSAIAGLFKKLPPLENFMLFFCSRSLRSIPLSVQKSLAAWSLDLYPLLLRDDIPTSLEVMAMQTRGVRCVSVLTAPEQLLSYVENGRDVLGFVVHDLIHADHFFQDLELAQAQICFARKLAALHPLPLIQNHIAADADFAQEWNYLISDMNSVPLHLFKSLKALFLRTFKRRAGLPFRDPLGAPDEFEFQNLTLSLAQALGLNGEQTAAWTRLNSTDFQMPQDAWQLHGALMVSSISPKVSPT